MSKEAEIKLTFKTEELAALAESLLKELGDRILLPKRPVIEVVCDAFRPYAVK